MYPYQKPQLRLLLDLVREANPAIDLPLDETSIKVGIPKSQAVPSGGIVDTNVTLSGRGKYFGVRTVQYRRINLGSFFIGNRPLIIRTWTAAPSTISSDEIVAYLNKVYGLAMVSADLPVKTFTGGNNFIQAIESTSLCYSGSLNFVWYPDKREISDAFTAPNLLGRTFPNGNDFSVGQKQDGEYMCYDLDFSPIASSLALLTASGVWSGTTPAGVAITNFLIANVSPIFKGDQPHTVDGGLNGLSFIKVNMPNAGVPDANSQSALFKTVVAIIAQPTSWFRGKLLMHYVP
jgi:hypothetical protein